MSGQHGSRTWFFPDGDIPASGDVEPKGHESLIMLNPGESDAVVAITVYFEDDEPRCWPLRSWAPVPPMASDDFAFFAKLAPALHMKLGVCGHEPCAPLHSGAFDADERAIGVGVGAIHELVRWLLARPLDSWATP